VARGGLPRDEDRLAPDRGLSARLVSRFRQAISEGDGISVIPLVAGDVEALAAAAERGGAEAIAVAATADAGRASSATALPVLVRMPVLLRDLVGGPGAGGADAVVVAYGEVADDDALLEGLLADAEELDLDWLLDVRDEEELEHALERVDPDIVLISRRDGASDEEELERALDLLPDVPAGKLVVAECDLAAREQVVALERAGVDALLVRNLAASPDDFSRAVEELVGGAPPT
jgi:indole-3-glycerol phosphate synthase